MLSSRDVHDFICSVRHNVFRENYEKEAASSVSLLTLMTLPCIRVALVHEFMMHKTTESKRRPNGMELFDNRSFHCHTKSVKACIYGSFVIRFVISLRNECLVCHSSKPLLFTFSRNNCVRPMCGFPSVIAWLLVTTFPPVTRF